MWPNAITILSHISMKYQVSVTYWIFSLCHVNIRSIRKNRSELESYLELLDHVFSIIGFTETWLNDSSCEIYGINGYSLLKDIELRLVVMWHYS